jgi:hypothetical protein
MLLALAYVAAQAVGGPHETAKTRALAARLPAAVYGSCKAADGDPGVTAAVRCSGTDPRVDAIEVRQVSSPAVLDARFRSLSEDRKLVTRRCAGETGNSGGFWTSGGARQGAFACFLDSSDHRRLLWQYSGADIEISAEVDDDSGTAAKKLYDWWSSEARDRPLSS